MTNASLIGAGEEGHVKTDMVSKVEAVRAVEQIKELSSINRTFSEKLPETSPPPHIFALLLGWFVVAGPRVGPTAFLISAIYARLKDRVRRRFILGAYMAWMLNYLFHVRPVRLRLGCEDDGGRVPDHRVPSAAAIVRARMVHIVRKCPSLSQWYWPTWCAPQSLLQVLLLLLKEVRARVLERNPYRRQILTLKDNAKIALDWVPPRMSVANQAELPVCVLLHGAFMDSSSVTMSDLARSLAAKGFPTVVMNRRGYGGIGIHGVENPRLALFGLDEDLDEAMLAIADAEPGRQVAIIGFSCGSGFATRYAGSRGHLSAWNSDSLRQSDSSSSNVDRTEQRMPRILCMVGMDGGYDASVEHGPAARLAWPYSFIINYTLKYFYVVRHWRPLKDAGKWQVMKRILNPMKGIVETYHESIALTGAEDTQEFIKLQNPVLHSIKVPSLLINSRDDPICVWDNVEYALDDITANPHIAHAELYCGTHGCKYNFLGFSSISESMISEFVHASLGEWKNAQVRGISNRGGG